MAKLTLSDARRTMGRGRPWTFRLEFHDPAANSHKFWLCTGRGRHEPVEVHYGRVGGKPQVLVKDWLYVEAKAPEKEVKGYCYADTGFVRVRQSTIDAHAATALTAAAKPLPAVVAPPKPAPAPKPATGNHDEWSCDKGGITITLKMNVIELAFDTFPAPWMSQAKTAGSLYGSFKQELRDFCEAHTRTPVNVWWGGTGARQFKVHLPDRALYRAIVKWVQGQIGSGTPALAPAPTLPGPFGKVVSVAAMGKGVWHAFNAKGNKVLALNAQGARTLVADYPHITVAGL